MENPISACLCSICGEVLSFGRFSLERELSSQAYPLTCGHHYCKGCWMEWEHFSRIHGPQIKCPKVGCYQVQYYAGLVMLDAYQGIPTEQIRGFSIYYDRLRAPHGIPDPERETLLRREVSEKPVSGKDVLERLQKVLYEEYEEYHRSMLMDRTYYIRLLSEGSEYWSSYLNLEEIESISPLDT